MHQVLRDELGFDGVVMTDDLIMEAITDYTGGADAAVLAVQAGNDMLVSSISLRSITRCWRRCRTVRSALTDTGIRDPRDPVENRSRPAGGLIKNLPLGEIFLLPVCS